MQLSPVIIAGPQNRGRNAEEELEELRGFLRLLTRELDVLLKNLDEENFNPQALERMKKELGL